MKKRLFKMCACTVMIAALTVTTYSVAFAGNYAQKNLQEEAFGENKRIEGDFMEPAKGDKLVASGFLSEYDIIRKLQELSDEELLQEGYAEEDVSKIRSINVDSEIEKILALSDNALRMEGLSNTEIKDFHKKAENNPEGAVRMVANGVQYNVYLTDGQFYYNAAEDITNLTAYMLWEWQSKPSVATNMYTDIVAMLTNNTNFIVKNAVTRVNYYYATLDASAESQTLTTYTFGSKVGSYAKFPMVRAIDGGRAYAKSGRISTNWVAGGNIRVVAFSGNYGHMKTAANPSVSVGTGFSISFAPENKIVYGPEATGDTL